MQNDETSLDRFIDDDAERCLIAYGGNQDNPATTLRAAIEKVSQLRGTRIVRRSSVYETTPVGANAGGSFLNGALLIATVLKPEELLDALQKIENELGRVRTVRWGPRTVDLDIITYGDRVTQTERLTLPHPASWYRRFVLDPTVEIGAEIKHPVFQKSFEQLRQQLMSRPMRVGVSKGQLTQIEAQQFCREIQNQFSDSAVDISLLAGDWQEEFDAGGELALVASFKSQAESEVSQPSSERMLMLAADPQQALSQMTEILTAALGPDA